MNLFFQMAQHKDMQKTNHFIAFDLDVIGMNTNDSLVLEPGICIIVYTLPQHLQETCQVILHRFPNTHTQMEIITTYKRNK